MTGAATHLHSTIATYQQAFREHGRSEAALLWTKNKQAERFAALCKAIPDTSTTVLDYGCGLGDLAVWLSTHRPRAVYLGADAVPEFIANNREALPGLTFTHVEHPDFLQESYDHVVCSGVFNLNPTKTPEAHWQYVQDVLLALFRRTRKSLHVDFLAHDVDYKHPQGYHQDLSTLLSFVERQLSRRYELDRSYMPYEYCVSIFKNVEIERSRNVYASPP